MDTTVFALESVTAIQSARPLWKIMSVDFGEFYTVSPGVADLATRALHENKLLKVDGSTNESGQLMLEAVVILERTAPENSHESIEPKTYILF